MRHIPAKGKEEVKKTVEIINTEMLNFWCMHVILQNVCRAYTSSYHLTKPYPTNYKLCLRIRKLPSAYEQFFTYCSILNSLVLPLCSSSSCSWPFVLVSSLPSIFHSQMEVPFKIEIHTPLQLRLTELCE